MGLSDFERYGSAAEKLRAAIGSSMVSHAYLIEGDSNADKVGFAKAFAMALLCGEDPGSGCGICPVCRKIAHESYDDLYIVRPEDKGTTSATSSVKDEQVEKLQAALKARPAAGDRNIAIISGADTMTPRAQNRLLKTLEEPNAGAVIMLLSENADQLLPTIDSRCVRVRLVSEGAEDDADAVIFAREILQMITEKAFFFDIKKKLDQNIKSRRDAFAFLDGMEAVFGEMLRTGSQKFDAGRIAAAVSVIEEKRRHIQGDAMPKYVVRDLILKLEDIR